jgi:hypothetical protein
MLELDEDFEDIEEEVASESSELDLNFERGRVGG